MEWPNWSYLSGETSDYPFMLVEFSDKLAKKERKFIYAAAAGGLQSILRFFGEFIGLQTSLGSISSHQPSLYLDLGFKKTKTKKRWYCT